MSETAFSLVALAFIVALIAGMVMAFARRSPLLAPARDRRLDELAAEVRALRARIDVLAEAQEKLLRRLEQGPASRQTADPP